jgi:signal transduction histidine kinase
MDQTQLIIDMLKEIGSDVRDVKERLHAGDRRMDAFEREILDLQQADEKTNREVKILKEKVSALEPVLEITNNMKKLIYVLVALFLVGGLGISLMPTALSMLKGLPK